jgi:hypothetical protein
MKDIKRKYSFSDIEFKPYFTEEEVNFIKKIRLMSDADKSMQGVVEFENGYGVSVLFGRWPFQSNGKDTYEVAVTYDGHIINRDNDEWVECFLNRYEVEKLMNNVAGLNPIVVDSFGKGDYLVCNLDKYHMYIVSPGRENIRLFGSFYERRKATYEEREKIFERLRKSLIV